MDRLDVPIIGKPFDLDALVETVRQAAARLAELPTNIAASLPKPASEVDAEFAESGAAGKRRRSPL